MYRIRLLFLSIMIATLSGIAFSILVPYKFMRVVSSSMEPTIFPEDIIVYTPLAELSRGDVVVFYSNNNDDKILVKRVIGISGDVIDISEDGIYVNSKLYIEDKVESLENCYTVPEGAVFVMGDNYSISVDSRCWKDPYVKQDDILGVVL